MNDNTKWLLLGAVALGVGFIYMKSGEQTFFVPGVGEVPVSQLGNYGYRNIGGQWYSQAQIDAAALQSGATGTIDPGTQTFLDFMAILQSLIPLATTVGTFIMDATQRAKMIQGILDKQLDPTQPHYTANPKYTKVELQSFSDEQLQKYSINASIAGIHYNCSDAGRDLSSGDPYGGKMLAHCRWGTQPK